VHSPLLGVELVFDRADSLRLPLTTGFEHGVLLMAGSATSPAPPWSRRAAVPADGPVRRRGRGRRGDPGGAAGRRAVRRGPGDVVELRRAVHEEIVQAREDWAAGRRFGAVVGCDHAPLPAPDLPTVRLKPRDRNGRYR
jgi:hypothetical protein